MLVYAVIRCIWSACIPPPKEDASPPSVRKNTPSVSNILAHDPPNNVLGASLPGNWIYTEPIGQAAALTLRGVMTLDPLVPAVASAADASWMLSVTFEDRPPPPVRPVPATTDLEQLVAVVAVLAFPVIELEVSATVPLAFGNVNVRFAVRVDIRNVAVRFPPDAAGPSQIEVPVRSAVPSLNTRVDLKEPEKVFVPLIVWLPDVLTVGRVIF